jgi:glycerophosphoryl diester phosphodiesterase
MRFDRSDRTDRTDLRFHAALLLLLACFCTSAQDLPTPLLHAHAHNDYEHTRPLFDALDQGFCSVEADIYLVDGKLLVAHQRSQVKPERTLQALYLDPLRERVKKNHGRVYPNGPECTLLIDLKTDWHQIYPVLRDVLKDYSDILSSFRGETKQTNALTAIITGTRSLEMFDGETVRYAAYDGLLSDLDSNASANLIPWISASWPPTFQWRGNGEFPPEQKQHLKEILAKAHQHGRKVRFWGAPDKPPFWRELLANGVDLINTDDLAGLRKFFDERQ